MNVLIRKRKSSTGKTSLFLEIYRSRTDRKYESLHLSYDRNTPPELRKTILEAAKKKRHIRETELLTNDYDLNQVKKRDESFVLYFQTKVDEKRGRNGYYNYKSVLEQLKKFNEGKDVLFKDIDANYIRRFKKYLLDHIKNNSAAGYLIKLNTILNFALEDNIIVVNPFPKKFLPRREGVVKVYLTETEIETLISTECHYSEVKRAFLFSCFTGLRFCDVKKLTWSEILDDKIQFKQKKTSEEEYIPLSETAKNIIYVGNNEKVIPLPTNKVFKLPVNHRTNSALLMWANKARIEKHITFHTSRHTFATLALTKGADLYTVSKLLGHKDISTTQIYAKIINEKLTEAMKALPVYNIKN